MKPPLDPPPWAPLIERIAGSGRLAAVIDQSSSGPTVGGAYRHWHTLRFLTPPAGLSHEEWWAAIKLARNAGLRTIPLRDKAGRPFRYGLPDPVLQMARGIDLDLGGHVEPSRDVLGPARRDRYLFDSLTEEAITSSQLEGATTTRVIAKEMLRTGRAPRDTSERMILANFRVMQRVRDVADAPLTPDLVLDLQRLATEGTLPPERQGLRRPGVEDHDVGVYSGNTLLHRPPPAGELAERLETMCAFANDPGDAGPFVPPAVRAILLHFWLAYDHPFVDGNGRTARALFYWSMLRQGYRLAEYVSVSRILRKAPARYGRSFLYTQTDDNDLTYFVLHHLDVLTRASDSLKRYVEAKGRESREVRAMLTPDAGLNHRQTALLTHALKHPGHAYTFVSHRTSHGVSLITARKDLLDLEARGHLSSRRLQRQGRPLVFTAPHDLGDRLREFG